MPNNSFTITISAVDKATATVRRINDAMGKATRPFEDARKSFKRFDSALADNPVVKSLGKMGGAALGAARSIGRIAAPIAAITGATSIAGITMLADRWAKFGRDVTYSSQRIGISTTALQRYQGVATLAGVSADGMASSLAGIGTAMEDARWGRNQTALMVFNKTGIGLKKTKEGLWDVNAQFLAMSKYMQRPEMKNNPWAQQLLADAAGASGAIDILRQGPEAIAKYEKLQKKLGYISSPESIQSANDFALSIGGLKIATEGLGQSLMDKAMPALRPFLDDLSGWVAQNRELISTDVSGWIKTIADYVSKINWKDVGSGITSFFTDAKGSASELKTVLDDVVAAFNKISDFKNGIQYTFQQGGSLDQALGAGGQIKSADNAMYIKQHGDDAAFKARQEQMAKDGSLLSYEAFKKSAGWLERLLPDSGIQADYQDYRNNKAAQSFMDPGSYKSPGGDQPRGLRNNNPGNLDYVGQAGSVKEAGPGGRFAVFNSPSQGIAALAHQLQLYGTRGTDTLSSIVDKYAPAKDHNNVSAYIAALSKDTGLDPTKHLDLNDPAIVGPLVSAITRHENGSDPYSPAMESNAVNIGLGIPQGPYSRTRAAAAADPAAPAAPATVHVVVSAAPGTAAKVKSADNVTASTGPRIGFSGVGAMA